MWKFALIFCVAFVFTLIYQCDCAKNVTSAKTSAKMRRSRGKVDYDRDIDTDYGRGSRRRFYGRGDYDYGPRRFRPPRRFRDDDYGRGGGREYIDYEEDYEDYPPGTSRGR